MARAPGGQPAAFAIMWAEQGLVGQGVRLLENPSALLRDLSNSVLIRVIVPAQQGSV